MQCLPAIVTASTTPQRLNEHYQPVFDSRACQASYTGQSKESLVLDRCSPPTILIHCHECLFYSPNYHVIAEILHLLNSCRE